MGFESRATSFLLLLLFFGKIYREFSHLKVHLALIIMNVKDSLELTVVNIMWRQFRLVKRVLNRKPFRSQ